MHIYTSSCTHISIQIHPSIYASAHTCKQTCTHSPSSLISDSQNCERQSPVSGRYGCPLVFHTHCGWLSLESAAQTQLWSENLMHSVSNLAQSPGLLSGFMFRGSTAFETAGTGQSSQPQQVLTTLPGHIVQQSPLICLISPSACKSTLIRDLALALQGHPGVVSILFTLCHHSKERP